MWSDDIELVSLALYLQLKLVHFQSYILWHAVLEIILLCMYPVEAFAA